MWFRNSASTREEKLRNIYDILGSAQCAATHPMREVLNFPGLQRDAALARDCLCRGNGT